MLPIPGFPHYYAKEDGTIWSCHRKGRGAIRCLAEATPLAAGMSHKGYQMVSIRDATGRPWTKYVHLLVTTVFHGSRPEGMQARHLDGDQKNNRACNLAWGTPEENEADRKKHGRTPRGESISWSRLTNAQAAEIRRRALSGEKGRDLAKEFGITATSVTEIKLGQTYAGAS